MRKLALVIPILELLCIIFQPYHAYAECDIVEPAVVIDLPSYDDSEIKKTFTVTLQQAGTGNCAGALFFENDTSDGLLVNAEDPASTLPYTITELGDTVDVINSTGDTPGQREVIEIPPFSSGSKTVTFEITVFTTENLRNTGFYSGTLDLLIQSGNSSSDDTITVSLGTVIQQILELEIRQVSPSPSAFSSAASVDFGVLANNEQAELELNVRTNISHRLSLVSENGGELWRSGTAGGSTSGFFNFVPYTIQLDNAIYTSADLPPGVAVETQTAYPLTGAPDNSTLLPLLITIGDVTDRHAGAYTDFITITVIPDL